MSIIRVPSTKEIPEEVTSIKEAVDKIPPVVNLSVETLKREIEEIKGSFLKKGGGVMDGGLVAPVIVAGTDPGGTEALRGETLRAGSSFLGPLTGQSAKFTSVEVGTAPSGSEVLRSENLRAGPSVIASLDVGTAPGGSEKLKAENLRTGLAIVGTDPGGSEKLRAESLRAGSGLFGTPPSGTEKLRAENLRAGATVLTGNLTGGFASFSAVVVGTDPGGGEVLRAQNLRAGATVLTGGLTGQSASFSSAVVGTDPGGSGVLRASSSTLALLYVTGSPPSDASNLYVNFNIGGSIVQKQVYVGAADSGGTGYRVLRVPN